MAVSPAPIYAAVAFKPALCIDGNDKRVDVIDTFRLNGTCEVIEMRAFRGPRNMHGF
jgi:steroid delta-isomerase